MLFSRGQSPDQVDVEGYKFEVWSFSQRCEVEDEANEKFNRFSKFSQWENEVHRLLFIRFCVSWPLSSWPEPVPCDAEAKKALYQFQTEMCRKLVGRASVRIKGILQDALKNWQTGLFSGKLTQ